ncbi:MAG: hypothetical protein P1P64_07455 [Treponemataceae bacterium]
MDNNIPLCEENIKIKACDGMLYNKNNTNDFIIFVELKSGKYLRNWRSNAIAQLKSTVKFFIKHHSLESYENTRKECYASNAKTEQVSIIQHNEMEKFKKATSGFILKIDYKIVL